MSDSRLDRLEDQVGDLREGQARNAEANEHLASAVKDLSDKVGELNDTINKGRGALWAISACAAGVGALGGMLGQKFLGG